MEMIGADPDALDELAGRIESAATWLESAQALITRRISTTPWVGSDAERFRSQWRTTHARRVGHAVIHLRDVSGNLRRNAQQQRDTSRAETGAIAGGFAGGGGGGGGWGSGREPVVLSERVEQLWAGGDKDGKGGFKGLVFGADAQAEMVTTRFSDGHVEVTINVKGFGGAGPSLWGLVGVVGGPKGSGSWVWSFRDAEEAERFKKQVEGALIPRPDQWVEGYGQAQAHKGKDLLGNVFDGDIGGALSDAGDMLSNGAKAGLGLSPAALIGLQLSDVFGRFQKNYAYAENQAGIGGAASAGIPGNAAVDLSNFTSYRWKTNDDNLQLIQQLDAHAVFAPMNPAAQASGEARIAAELILDYDGVDLQNADSFHLASAVVHFRVEGQGSLAALGQLGLAPQDAQTAALRALELHESGGRIDLEFRVPLDSVAPDLGAVRNGRIETPSAADLGALIRGSEARVAVSTLDVTKHPYAILGHSDTTATLVAQGTIRGNGQWQLTTQGGSVGGTVR